jgi:hypothetical protein
MADAPVIHFDKARFLSLMAFISDRKKEVDAKFLTNNSGDLMLDDQLGKKLKPGSTNWDPAAAVIGKATTFGSSVQEKLGSFSDDLAQYYTELGKALSIYQDHDDLASVEASSFLSSYPKLGGPTA